MSQFPTRMGNKQSSIGITSPRGSISFIPGSTPVTPDPRNQYKRALNQIPRARVRQIRQIFDELKRQSNTSGDKVDRESFLRYFPLPGMMGERLFDVFDQDRSGAIDFPEFLTGVTTIYHGTLEDKKKFLFDMYDLDGNGEVTRQELSTMLSYIPAAFHILDFHDRLDSPQLSEYIPSPHLDKKIHEIVESVFGDSPPCSTLSFDAFKAALSHNPTISEMINVFYDEALPENELTEYIPGSEPESIRRGISKPSAPISPRQSLSSPLCCPLCGVEIFFAHCMQCGGKLGPSSNCAPCDYTYPAQNYCHHCGHPLRSTLVRPSESPMLVSPVISPSGGSGILRGYLSKIGRTTQIRKSRFFSLRDCFLYYYLREEDEANNPDSPKGVIFLTGLYVSPLKTDTIFGFVIRPARGKKKRVFYCDSLDQQTTWLNALVRATKSRDITRHYNIDYTRKLGVGKFSSVYEGNDISTHTPVAVKIISVDQIATSGNSEEAEEEREFLRTELAIVKLVHHENIVRTIDIFETPESIFIVLERVHGGDLLHRLQRDGRLSEFETQRIVLALLTAVEYLHHKGIVHRDIKPENILITEESGTIKLTDFGLSALSAPHAKTLDAPLGTIGYAAPEVVLSIPYDKSVDLWSIGAVTYVMLSGQLPFRGPTDREVAARVIEGKVSMTSKPWGSISDHAKNFVGRLLVKSPGGRMTTAQALAHEWLN